MKRLLIIVSILLVASICHAQNANTLTIRFSGAPSGPCAPFMLGVNNATGGEYNCTSGGAWNLIGGGGGSGTVTSVSFTGGLISVANPTTTPAFTVAGTSGGIPYFSGAATWASSAALTANALVLGGGAGTTPATNTAFTTNGTTTLTVGIAGGGNGALALSGNTSGNATFTAPAIAGTVNNPVVSSNAIQVPSGTAILPGIAFPVGGGAATGIYRGADNQLDFTVNALDTLQINTAGIFPRLPVCDFSAGNNCLTFAAGLISTSGAGTPIFKATNNVAILTSDFTDSNASGLQVITGLSFALPSLAKNWSFHCSLTYSEATPIASDQFGVASLTTAATNLHAWAHVITAEGATAAQTTGDSGNITNTTPTSIVTFTPVGTGIKQADIDGSIEVAGGGASTLQFYVTNGTAADVIVVKRDSYCEIR